MDDLTFAMEIIKGLQDLFRNDLHVADGDAAIVRTDDQFEKIVSEHFEDHAHVCTVRTCDFEFVEQLNTFEAVGVGRVRVSNTGEELDFVQRCFGVMLCTFHHFHGDEQRRFTVPAEPNR